MWSAWDRPGSQTLRCGSALHPLSDREQFGKEGADVREQQGRRMKHDNREGEVERCDMRTANTSSHARTRCLYATQGKCVRKMCVRHEAFGTPTVELHEAADTTWVRNPETKKKSSDFVIPLPILISPTNTLSTNLLSTDQH